MPAGTSARPLDLEALAAEVAKFLDNVPAAEGVGAKLNRALQGFLATEVLPQAERAAAQGLDPTPFRAVVANVLRIYADALERPDAAHR